MEAKRIVHQVNSICSYFESYEKQKAVQGIANHLQNFWAPPLRQKLMEYAKTNGEGLNPLISEVIPLLTF